MKTKQPIDQQQTNRSCSDWESDVVWRGGIAKSDADTEDVRRDTYGFPSAAPKPENARQRIENAEREPEKRSPGRFVSAASWILGPFAMDASCQRWRDLIGIGLPASSTWAPARPSASRSITCKTSITWPGLPTAKSWRSRLASAVRFGSSRRTASSRRTTRRRRTISGVE